MLEDDNLNPVAGEPAGDVTNPSEEAAAAAPEKDTKATPTEEGAGEKDTPDAGEDAGEKRKSGSARKTERIRELEAKLAELEQRVKAPEPEAPPKLEDYPDWDAHQRAVARFEARQEYREQSQQQAKSELTEARQAMLRETVEAHQSRVIEARERIPDFDKTLKAFRDAGHQPPSPEVYSFILESEKSPLLEVHLATRPELVRELNNLNPVAAARRIGQIEARLSYPAPKTQSAAPAPMGAVKGGASPQKDPSSLSYAEFKAFREKGGTIR